VLGRKRARVRGGERERESGEKNVVQRTSSKKRGGQLVPLSSLFIALTESSYWPRVGVED